MSVEMANHLHMIEATMTLFGPPVVFGIVLGGFWLVRKALGK